MGRTRHLHPSFFRHAGLFDAERETGLPVRVGFAGLWTVADREGRFRWRPREIKPDILPYDEVDFSAVLEALEQRGFVVRYVVSGKEFGWIPTFLDWQKPHPREAPSRIPPPTEGEPPPIQGEPKANLGHAKAAGYSGPSESQALQAFQDPRMPEMRADAGARGAPRAAPPPPAGRDADATRDRFPAAYQPDYDAHIRASHRPQALRDEIGMILDGGRPDCAGATAEHIGQALRDLAMKGTGAISTKLLRGFVRGAMREPATHHGPETEEQQVARLQAELRRREAQRRVS